MRAHFIFDARHKSAKLIERKCAERPGAVYPFSVRFSARGKDYALAARGVKSGLSRPQPCRSTPPLEWSAQRPDPE